MPMSASLGTASPGLVYGGHHLSPPNPSPHRCLLVQATLPPGPMTVQLSWHLARGNPGRLGAHGHSLQHSAHLPCTWGTGLETGRASQTFPLSKTFPLLPCHPPMHVPNSSLGHFGQRAFSLQRMCYRFLQKIGGAIDLTLFLFYTCRDSREKTQEGQGKNLGRKIKIHIPRLSLCSRLSTPNRWGNRDLEHYVTYTLVAESSVSPWGSLPLNYPS